MYNLLDRLGYRYGQPKLVLKHRQDPKEVASARRQKASALKKNEASAGRRAFAYVDEAEFHLNPGLSRCWSKRGERVIVPAACQNRRVPVFGALDAMTGEVTTLITRRKRSADFL